MSAPRKSAGIEAWPGVVVHVDEDIAAAAARELLEETGLRLDAVHLEQLAPGFLLETGETTTRQGGRPALYRRADAELLMSPMLRAG